MKKIKVQVIENGVIMPIFFCKIVFCDCYFTLTIFHKNIVVYYSQIDYIVYNKSRTLFEIVTDNLCFTLNVSILNGRNILHLLQSYNINCIEYTRDLCNNYNSYEAWCWGKPIYNKELYLFDKSIRKKYKLAVTIFAFCSVFLFIMAWVVIKNI